MKNVTLGDQYHDDREHYNFTYTDNDGKHVSVSFNAEYYDLDIIFDEFKNFLIASGHDIEGNIGELGTDDGYDDDEDDDGYEEDEEITFDELAYINSQEQKNKLAQNRTQDKFSMDHLPNNGWPFGGLTTTDISAFSGPVDWSKVNQYPTMAPLSTQQVQSWSLSTEGIRALTSEEISAWTVPAPGTLGGAKVEFK